MRNERNRKEDAREGTLIKMELGNEWMERKNRGAGEN
jgi:hypothetical protein